MPQRKGFIKMEAAKRVAGFLAAAACLGWAARAQAFWTDGGQGGGALEQLGLSAGPEVDGPLNINITEGGYPLLPAPAPSPADQGEIEITEDAPDAGSVCNGASGKPARSWHKIVGTLDNGEDRIIRAVLDIRALRQAVLRRWQKPAKLYRFVQARELKNLADNGWAYDLKDPRNMYKFATPRIEVARSMAKEYGDGAVLEIDAEQAIPYYEISRIYWGNRNEHIILINGKEKIRPVEYYRCGSATAGP